MNKLQTVNTDIRALDDSEIDLVVGGVIDGCIMCPWHGYQYLPETGASPPPFSEKVPTFHVRVKNGRVFVHPKPNPAGTRVEPASVGADSTPSHSQRTIDTR